MFVQACLPDDCNSGSNCLFSTVSVVVVLFVKNSKLSLSEKCQCNMSSCSCDTESGDRRFISSEGHSHR